MKRWNELRCFCKISLLFLQQNRYFINSPRITVKKCSRETNFSITWASSSRSDTGRALMTTAEVFPQSVTMRFRRMSTFSQQLAPHRHRVSLRCCTFRSYSWGTISFCIARNFAWTTELQAKTRRSSSNLKTLAFVAHALQHEINIKSGCVHYNEHSRLKEPSYEFISNTPPVSWAFPYSEDAKCLHSKQNTASRFWEY